MARDLIQRLGLEVITTIREIQRRLDPVFVEIGFCKSLDVTAEGLIAENDDWA